MSCLNSFRTENKFKSLEKACKDFYEIVIPYEKKKVLEFNQYMKSDKMAYVRKIDRCANNSEKSFTMKIGVHIPRGYSMSTIWRFDHTENKQSLYHGKDCMKKFYDF